MSEVEGEIQIDHITSADRAAILLLTLGEADAAKVLQQMEPKEVQRVGTAMAAIAELSHKDITGVFDFFLKEVSGRSGLALGSSDYVRKMLTTALGEDRSKGLLDRILGSDTAGLEKLKWMDALTVADLIRYEHPQIQAIVLSYLDPDQSADVLARFEDPKVRADIVVRVANLSQVPPDALQELNEIFEQQVSGKSSSRFASLGGVDVAADIMNNLSGGTDELMEGIRETDENLGEKIQDLMFVFGNLTSVDDRGIQSLLREVSSDVLLVALKGADEELKEKIYGNMSKRAAELLNDDLEAKGPVRLSEVEEAQKEILAVARRLAESGQIVLGGAGGEEML